MAQPSFEKDLEKLESIVEALEEGGLSLDEALKRFEEGVKLARRCDKTLTDAERRIEILTRNADGELEAQPFDEEASEGEAPPAPSAAATKRKPKTETAAAASAPPGNAEEETDEDGELLF